MPTWEEDIIFHSAFMSIAIVRITWSPFSVNVVISIFLRDGRDPRVSRHERDKLSMAITVARHSRTERGGKKELKVAGHWRRGISRRDRVALGAEEGQQNQKESRRSSVIWPPSPVPRVIHLSSRRAQTQTGLDWPITSDGRLAFRQIVLQG